MTGYFLLAKINYEGNQFQRYSRRVAGRSLLQQGESDRRRPRHRNQGHLREGRLANVELTRFRGEVVF
jgi:hypothetical protein